MAPGEERLYFDEEAAEHIKRRLNLADDDFFVRLIREFGYADLHNLSRSERRDEIFEFIALEHRRDQRADLGPKPAILDDIFFALKHHEQCQKDFSKIREEYRITGLDFSTDISIFEDRNAVPRSSSRSAFWRGRGLKEEESFDKTIRDLIDTYEHVPMLMFPWVKLIIMYPESELRWEPLQGTLLLTQSLKNPGDFKKLPLTTEERKHLLAMAKNILGLSVRSGRPKKNDERAEMYAAVASAVRSSPKGRYRDAGISMSPLARKIYLMRKCGKTYHEIVSTLYPAAKNIIKKMEEAKSMNHRVKQRIAELTKKSENN